MNIVLYNKVTDALQVILERAVQKELVEYRYQLWLNYKPIPSWGTQSSARPQSKEKGY